MTEWLVWAPTAATVAFFVGVALFSRRNGDRGYQALFKAIRRRFRR